MVWSFGQANERGINSDLGLLSSYTGIKFLDGECKSIDRKPLALKRDRQRYENQCQLRDHLADLLQSTKYAHLAPKVRACHRIFSGFRCANGHEVAKPTASCDCRLCAFEARERSMRMQKRFARLIQTKKRMKYAVLSEVSTPNLKAGISHLWASWARLRESAIWTPVRGAVVVLEVTYNKEEGIWHPHLNVLLDCPDWIDRARLGDAWCQATGDPNTLTPWICAANDQTIKELLKYITKLSDLIGYDDPALIEEFLDATRRVRFVRTYGSFYGLGRDNEGEDAYICPDCGGQLHQFAHRLYLHQVELDGNGIWRPLHSPITTQVGVIALQNVAVAPPP